MFNTFPFPLQVVKALRYFLSPGREARQCCSIHIQNNPGISDSFTRDADRLASRLRCTWLAGRQLRHPSQLTPTNPLVSQKTNGLKVQIALFFIQGANNCTNIVKERCIVGYKSPSGFLVWGRSTGLPRSHPNICCKFGRLGLQTSEKYTQLFLGSILETPEETGKS